MKQVFGTPQAVFVCLAAAGLACAASAQILGGDTIMDFRWPDYDEESVLKSVLTGASAEVKDDGSVDIVELKMEFYENGTNVQMEVTAPQCTYDRRRGVARSDSSVHIESEQMIVTGEDFTFDKEQERFQIRKNARVEIKNARNRMEASMPAKERDE